MLKDWNSLPECMRKEEVKKYYRELSGKRLALGAKRFLDVVLALILTVQCQNNGLVFFSNITNLLNFYIYSVVLKTEKICMPAPVKQHTDSFSFYRFLIVYSPFCLIGRTGFSGSTGSPTVRPSISASGHTSVHAISIISSTVRSFFSIIPRRR